MKFTGALLAAAAVGANAEMLRKPTPLFKVLEPNSVPCDGTDFKCNSTGFNITDIANVNFATTTGKWEPNVTATLNFTGQLTGDIDITAGTTHFKIWEGGVPHFRVNGNSDYFQCGPAPAGCDKTKPISLYIDDPTNLTSTCHVELSFPLPEAMASGIFTVDVYGEDEDHEPYDFILNLAYRSE